jgi:3-oxoacyl-[acyl-carrier-protein] synthase-3
VASDRADAIPPLELVRRTAARELEPLPLPADDEDLAQAGLVDSMMRVNILLAVEESAGVAGFAAEWPDDRPFSIREIAERLRQAQSEPAGEAARVEQRLPSLDPSSDVSINGWASSLGSLIISAGEVASECGFERGFLQERTGIETVRRASAGENEITLAVTAAESAVEMAGMQMADVDVLVGISTTQLGFPSFAASLHTALLLRENAGAIDIGGACCGAIYGLATASSLLSAMNRRAALVVASEVNSRRLAALDAPPEFRALFGDGACAFVLERSTVGGGGPGGRLREFIWGASGTFASALTAFWPPGGEPRVGFSGQQLAGAAVETLERVLDRIAIVSGVPISDVDQFALHEPNPRVLVMLARKAGLGLDKVPQTSQSCGNLGSVTCGVNLCKALTARAQTQRDERSPVIFAATVGPGLLWGGACIG